MENQPQSEEIDLGQIFAKIGNFLKDIGLGLIRFLALLRSTPLKNKTLFIVVTLAGAVWGYSYSSFLRKKYYDSSMILSSEYLNKRIVDNSINKLNQLAAEASPSGLANVLHISDSLAANIIRFESKPFVAEKELIEIEVLKEQLKSAQLKNQVVIDQIIKRIEIENQHAFEFTVRTFSPTVVKPLQDALVNYFKNNDYTKKRIQINHENLIAKKDKLKRESSKLDSLKKVIFSNYKTMAEQSRQGSNNVILSDKAVTNPIEIYSEDLKLYNQLQIIEREIYIQPDFEVVDGFTEFSEPASDRRLKTIVIAMLIAFGLGYVIVGLKQFNRYLATFQ